MTIRSESVRPDEHGSRAASAPAMVDPRAPRFGQTLTALGFGTAIIFDIPAVLYAVTAVMVLAIVSRWRLDVYALLWRTLVIPILGAPEKREHASPHRFARLMGAIGGTLASAFVLGGIPIAGYAIAGVVALLAGLAASTGICVGCRLYSQVQFFRNLGVV